MARGPYTSQLTCAADGCYESDFISSPTLHDRRDSLAHYAKHPFRCFRHSHPDEVLSADNPGSTVVLVRGETAYGRQSWIAEEGVRGGGGLLYGPGWRAIAKDFPPGTKLTIAVTVELPEDVAAGTER